MDVLACGKRNDRGNDVCSLCESECISISFDKKFKKGIVLVPFFLIIVKMCNLLRHSLLFTGFCVDFNIHLVPCDCF